MRIFLLGAPSSITVFFPQPDPALEIKRAHNDNLKVSAHGSTVIERVKL